MDQPQLRIEATRGHLVESTHPVIVAIVDAEGRLLASSGNPMLETWWRSAAKPFQSLPLILDGVAEKLGLDDEMLALACGSNSSEQAHVALAARFMAKAGVKESELACGIHPPLSPVVARAVACGTATMTPSWSNCSGKHIGMLALAQHHGWPASGYQSSGHPVQQRVMGEVVRWTGIPSADLRLSVDGCTAVCFGLPVKAMARAYAQLAVSTDSAVRRMVGAMMAHPLMVAGNGRLCTDLMAALPGRIVAKVGADGIYCAGVPELGVGIALKVIDGDSRASGLALLDVLRQWTNRSSNTFEVPPSVVAQHGPQPILNTRGVATGELRAAGTLRFFDD